MKLLTDGTQAGNIYRDEARRLLAKYIDQKPIPPQWKRDDFAATWSAVWSNDEYRRKDRHDPESLYGQILTMYQRYMDLTEYEAEMIVAKIMQRMKETKPEPLTGTHHIVEETAWDGSERRWIEAK